MNKVELKIKLEEDLKFFRWAMSAVAAELKVAYEETESKEETGWTRFDFTLDKIAFVVAWYRNLVRGEPGEVFYLVKIYMPNAGYEIEKDELKNIISSTHMTHIVSEAFQAFFSVRVYDVVEQVKRAHNAEGGRRQ